MDNREIVVGFPLRAGDGTLPLSGQNNCGDPPRPPIFAYPGMKLAADLHVVLKLTLNIPSLARQRCLSSWGPRRTPCFFFFFVISQLLGVYLMELYWLGVFCVLLLLLGGRAGGDTLNPAVKLLTCIR